MARGIEWANANEGLLQGVTMLGGVAALVVSLRQQRGVVAGRADAGPRLPALLWVGPVPDPDPKRWGEVLRSYGGRVETAAKDAGRNRVIVSPPATDGSQIDPAELDEEAAN